ncbi:uncharacterized protein LOC141695213 [Apium graveolens]|uniref:uncharacterized protein LOC141695213 n=1 Tax=Apium graveolens TaxID=4045 RepID=UPI003D79F8B2
MGHTEVVEVLIEAARHLPPSANDNPITSFQAFLRHAAQDSNTALHVAVMYGHVAIVKLLVEADATDKHIQNDEGKTPMYIAVEQGLNDIVEIISTTCEAPSLEGPYLSTAMPVNNLDQVKIPGGILYKIMDGDALYAAAIAGDADAIAELGKKANITLDEQENTILHIESISGNAAHVRLILTEFANKNLLVKLNCQQQTALACAAYLGHTEVVEILIDAARHLPPFSANENPHNRDSSFQAFLRQGDKYSDTALHAAVLKGHVDVVKLLVEADPADKHTQNSEGKTPMYIAVEQGFNDIVEIISTTCPALSLDGPDGSSAVRVKNLDQGNSPGGTLYKIKNRDALYAAAIDGDAEAIAILEMKADIVDGYGRTILHVESREGNKGRVQFILREFANKNLLMRISDEYKITALHVAIFNGHTQVAVVIINTARQQLPLSSFQAFLRQEDNKMRTALHVAVWKGNVAMAKRLVMADPTYTHTQTVKVKHHCT